MIVYSATLHRQIAKKKKIKSKLDLSTLVSQWLLKITFHLRQIW